MMVVGLGPSGESDDDDDVVAAACLPMRGRNLFGQVMEFHRQRREEEAATQSA